MAGLQTGDAAERRLWGRVYYLFVAPVANLGHRELPLETTPHSVVDTLWFPPCLLDTVVTIGLVAPMRGVRDCKNGIKSPPT